jgi:hypothetical protein
VSGELVRASDAERERSVALLREHFAEGRLTLEEFVERVDALYRAATLGDLDAALHELPVAAPARRGVTRLVLARIRNTGPGGYPSPGSCSASAAVS